MIITFNAHFLYWWTLWGDRGDVEWNYPRFLYLAIPAVVLYLQATVLVSSTPRAVRSWRDHYYESAPLFFGLNILLPLTITFRAWVTGHAMPTGSGISVASVALLSSLACIVTRKPWIHGVALTLMVGINLLSSLLLAFSPQSLD
jgi:hypothetical protein